MSFTTGHHRNWVSFASSSSILSTRAIVWAYFSGGCSLVENGITVRVSQPPFLIALCCGIIISSLSIIPMGAQTEYRYTKDELSTGLLTEQDNPDIALVDTACMM